MGTARIRTRFSPSPTGDLHAGGLRTALFNYLFARAHNGTFILRIEDTDTTRSTIEYEERITEDLIKLGLVPDEGPAFSGRYGPYRQSERTELYTAHALELIEKGLAYRCYCTAQRLEEIKSADIKAGRPPRYDGRCDALDESSTLIKESTEDGPPVIRFRVPKKSIRFHDSVHGEMSFESSAFGDFVIIGSDGIASYNFAVTIDDALMEITHVMRGDDHLPNTPRQLLIYEALGFKPPEFSHLPLVLAPDKNPLSKRHSHLSVRALRENGYLNSAILNTTARLGWSPKTDNSAPLMDLEEMAKKFDAKRLSKSPSLFDPAHLGAFNRLAITALEPAEILKMVTIEEDSVTACSTTEAIEAVKQNCSTLQEVVELATPLTTASVVQTEETTEILSSESAKGVIRSLLDTVGRSSEPIIGASRYKEIIEVIKRDAGAKGRKLFMPIRCALTGRTDGIELEKIVQLLGKETIIKRLNKVL